MNIRNLIKSSLWKSVDNKILLNNWKMLLAFKNNLKEKLLPRGQVKMLVLFIRCTKTFSLQI